MSIDESESSAALCASTIRSELGASLSDSQLHLYASLDSTNTFLLSRSDTAGVDICAAEAQTQGRGRRGRVWRSPNCGVTFSMRLTVPVPLSQIGGGSLVCGVTLCEILRELGVTRAAVKWPNDILIGSAKLAGILVEIAAHSNRSTTLVVGIGINYQAGVERQGIDREIIDLHQLFDGDPPDRSRLIGRVCKGLYSDLPANLPLQAAFIENWQNYDALAGQTVIVKQSGANLDSVSGLATGIDKRGYLIVETDSGTRFFSSAEVTLQRSPD